MDKKIGGRDDPITMDAGLILRAVVFRSKDSTPCPVVTTHGVYEREFAIEMPLGPMDGAHVGKGRGHREGSEEFMVWERVDPETWLHMVTRSFVSNNAAPAVHLGSSTRFRTERSRTTTTPWNGPGCSDGAR